MKKNAADNFYLNVVMWTFFCLVVAGISYQIKCGLSLARESGYESDALQVIQTINTLQKQHAAKNQGKLSPSFGELIKSEDSKGFFNNAKAYFIDERMFVRGYVFRMKISKSLTEKPAFYSINADPEDCENRCRRFYYDSTLKIIKFTDENRPVNAADPAI